MHNDISCCILACGGSSQNGDNELRDTHSNCTPEKDWPTTPLLDDIQPRERGSSIHTVGDQTDGEGVVKSRVLEKLSTIIEDKIDTSELLESLKTTSRNESLEKISFETINVGGISEVQFILMVGLDFCKFLNNCWIILWQASDPGKSLGCARQIVLFDQIARGLWKNQHSSNKDNSPTKLDGDWNAI